MSHKLCVISYSQTYHIKPSKGQETIMADKLFDYGCWCRLNEEIISGHGTPVDAIDEACKAWHQCRKCTSIDFKSCDPSDVTYDVGLDHMTLRITCENNPSSCGVSMNRKYWYIYWGNWTVLG